VILRSPSKQRPPGQSSHQRPLKSTQLRDTPSEHHNWPRSKAACRQQAALHVQRTSEAASSHSPESKGCMTAAVVKLNALPNPVGATPQNQHLGLVCGHGLALPIIGAVHVGCCSLKLCCTSVHSLEGGLHLQLLSLGPDCFLFHSCRAIKTDC